MQVHRYKVINTKSSQLTLDKIKRMLVYDRKMKLNYLIFVQHHKMFQVELLRCNLIDNYSSLAMNINIFLVTTSKFHLFGENYQPNIQGFVKDQII